ncbi:MAG: OmpH/Skp family outer membrane protein [Fimbriimonadaceae bacterium]
MKKLNKDLCGWMVAAILGGVLASSGFQGTPESTAVVDLQKVIKGSDLYKLKEAEFQAQVDARQNLLKFINDNRVITAEQWIKLRDLSLKPNPTDADKADLQTLKTAISARTKQLADLQVKANKTADDVTVMEAMQRDLQQTNQAAGDLQTAFGREIPVLQEEAAKIVEDQARIASAAIGKEQGYTIVFDTLAAPYGSHDITADSLTRMNKK